jgi:hypothetical protein
MRESSEGEENGRRQDLAAVASTTNDGMLFKVLMLQTPLFPYPFTRPSPAYTPTSHQTTSASKCRH